MDDTLVSKWTNPRESIIPPSPLQTGDALPITNTDLLNDFYRQKELNEYLLNWVRVMMMGGEPKDKPGTNKKMEELAQTNGLTLWDLPWLKK